jgi:DNA-binding response OmpR family regulator
VLLIEQHRHLTRALRQGLEEEGYAVTIAHDGPEADLQVAAGDFDLLLLDPRLPNEDGLSLLQRWRDRGLETRVLVLTTHPIADTHDPPVGADDHLSLPFKLEELFARLRALTRFTPRPAG